MAFHHCNKSILLLFYIAWATPLSTIAQQVNSSISQNSREKQISFRNLTVESGLSQNSIISISQDSIGYLWFATQDGLNKYDGRGFKYYKKQFEDVTSPDYNRLGKIYIDKENTIWLITLSGVLEKFNTETEEFIPLKRFNSVSSIYQDKALNIYVGTYNKGVFKINQAAKDTIQLLQKQDFSKAIYDYVEHDNNIIVIGANAVFRISSNDQYKPLVNMPRTLNYSCITVSKNNKFWIGTFGNGLFSYDQNNNKFSQFSGFQDYQLPKDLNIQDVLLDSKNRLWVATYGQGVYLIDFNLNTLKHFTENKNNPISISYNDVLTLFEDFTGIVWLGTDGGGVNYYDEHLSKFNVFTNNQTPDDINIDVIRAITTDDSNNIWLGTSGKGLSFISNEKKTFKTYTSENSALNSNRVMSLLANNDNLWIGHQGEGLNILNANGIFNRFNKSTEPKLPAATIWCIYKDSKNQIWLGTRESGLILFNKEEGVIEHYKSNIYSKNSITSNNIRALVEDNNSTLWIGTDDKGLSSLNINTKKIRRISKIKSQIKSLYVDDFNTLWVGTNGDGLISYNITTKQTQEFTIENGLPNNVIYGILPDNNQNLWLSSNKGITKFNTKDYSTANYSNYDGLQAFEFNTGAAYKDNQNNLYFGGIEGLNWFNPKQLTFNPIQPKTVISKFEIFTENQPLRQNNTFEYDQNTVTFTFASLHFSLPERNLYKYKLVNHDIDWIESGNINTAHYTNLAPNNYEFQVISSNYDGVWNETPKTFKFTIKQPWFINNTVKLIYAFLCIAFIFSIYKYSKWRYKIKLQLELKQAETERLKDLDEFKTKLYTNISHEFRTPLTLILSPTENQLSKSNLEEKDKTDLTLIQRNAKRLLNLVNQLLDLARLETGNLKLKIEHDNLGVLINQLASSFKYKANEKQINFKTNISNIPDAWYDKDIIEKIITNLLSNAIKYTPKKGRVLLNTNVQGNYALITIVNNGSKIKPEDLVKLFTRFYQVNSHADGVGIGLALVKELVSLTHGTLVVNTINDDQIQFTITLPINKEAFNETDFCQTSEVITKNEIAIDYEKIHLIENDNTTKPVLLIVEDDKYIRNYIESILEVKYKIIKAKNGEIGIKKALENIPDLIISDILMPKANGIELCNTLKTNMLTSHIPIILLTAKIDEENELKGLEVGADDFITKPFKSRILVKRISNLISLRKSLQKRYSQNAILKSKDFAITSMDKEFLSKVEDVLEKHLANPNFNAEAFSKHMLVSRMQLHRKLVALTGLTTSNFIRSQRLNEATLLLQKSDYTISEIAYQIGFNTPSYFIKCFKEAYNCTPNDYISNT